MDPPLPASSLENSDAKPSFRKPAQDAANRKYRRRTPVSGSDSEGSPKRQSHSPVYPGDRRRKDGDREFEKDSKFNQSSRGSDYHRHSDKHAHRPSHDCAKNGDYRRQHRHGDEEDMGYHRSSRSVQESRRGNNSDYMRHGRNADRSREIWRSGDKYSTDKSGSTGQRFKDKDYRHNDKDSDKGREGRDERKDRRWSPEDYKKDHRSSREESRAHGKAFSSGREGDSTRLKDTLISGNKEIDVPKDKRKYEDRASDMRSEKNSREAEAEVKNKASQQNASLKKLKHCDSEDEDPSASSKQVKGTAEKFTFGPSNASMNQSETAQDLNAAKVAAIKAAEVVNRNLVGGSSYLSTDQKKKLLWGNKKNTTAEEKQLGNHWDLQLFADRERQEKFNKLMSLRLPWCLWPIVGCKGRCHPRAKTQRDGRREEAEARDGLGEAVHCRTPAKRWPNCRPWVVNVTILTNFHSPFECFVINVELQMHPLCSREKFRFVLYTNGEYVDICPYWFHPGGAKDLLAFLLLILGLIARRPRCGLIVLNCSFIVAVITSLG
ncbi:TRAF3-interacting protein 1 isoform X2 [Asparagus officinalis]|uniref:TRAF3-interacting protein 1 isoform X2 n=1 Tax=Asparagus officinalis TaxID=4686 RepID=UPI00098E0E67|nr:TRAF3-interacting protein 1 isoform X2 [Asparagus officinalis]